LPALCGWPAFGSAVQPRHDRLVAAIGHVVNQPAIAASNVERLQYAELRLMFDHAAPIARRLVEIDDAAIQRMRRVELAERRAVQPLIGADRGELGTIENRGFPLSDFDPPYAAAIAHRVLPAPAGS
jgi:hypothetical protein